jgi:hypothetical protein
VRNNRDHGQLAGLKAKFFADCFCGFDLFLDLVQTGHCIAVLLSLIIRIACNGFANG